MSHIKDIVHGSVLALDFSYRLSLCVCVSVTHTLKQAFSFLGI